MAKVAVLAPDGTFGDIEDSELKAALSQGFRLPTDEESAKAAEAAKYDAPGAAGAIAGLRGASLGLTDRFLVGAGLAQKEQLRALEEHNTKASIGGEVFGTIAASIIPGGQEGVVTSAPALLSRLGGAAERGVTKVLGGAAESTLGKIAAKAAGGAAEGAAYGVSGEADRAYLEDRELTAERLLAAGGLNALLGGGLAGVLTGGGVVVDKALGALGGEGASLSKLPELLRKKANERAEKAAGLIQSDYNKLTEEQRARLGRDLIDANVIPSGANAEQIKPLLKEAKSAAGERVGEIIDRADATSGGSGAEVRKVIRERVRAAKAEQDAQLGAVSAFEKDLRARADDGLAGLEETRKTVEARVDGLLEQARASSGAVPFDAGEFTRDIVKLSRMSGRTGTVGGGTAAKLVPGEAAGFEEALLALQRKMSKAHESRTREEVLDLVGQAAPGNPVDFGKYTDDILDLANRVNTGAAGGVGQKLERGALGAEKGFEKAKAELVDRMIQKEAGAFDPLRPNETLHLLPDEAARESYIADLVGRQRAAITAPPDPTTFTQGVGFDLRAFIQKARSEILPKLDDPATEDLKKSLEKLIGRYEKRAAAGVSFKEAAGFKNKLDKTISKFVDTNAAQGMKVDVRRALDDEIERQLGEKLGATGLQAYQEAKAKFGSLAAASKANKKAIDRFEGNRAVSLTDYLTGIGGAVAGVATGNVAPLILAAAGAIGNKVMRARGSSVAANALDSLAKSDVVAALSRGMSEKTRGMVADALSTGSRVVERGAVSAGSPLEQPFLPMFASDKKPKDRREAFAQRMDELSKMSGDPSLLTDHMTAAVAGLPPDIQTAVSERTTRAVAFLSSRAPKRPSTSPFPALERPWHPSDADVSTFERYLGIINDPLSVMDNLKQGRVTREAVEALQAVYPKMYEDIRGAVAERLGDAHNPIGYNQRLSLGVLFGVPATPELEPTYLQLLQSAPPQSGGPGPSSAPSGKPYHADNGLAPASERLLRNGT